MRTLLRAATALTLVATAALGVSSSAKASTVTDAAACGTLNPTTSYQHVVWVWFENHSYGDVIGNAAAPNFTALAGACGSASNFHSVTHPSGPNYVGAVSGIPLAQLPATDCTTCKQSAPSLFSEVSWAAYEESMAAPCATTKSADGLYVPRHNPATFFTYLLTTNKTKKCNPYDVALSKLTPTTALPAFTFITPNLNSDMHNGTVQTGDAWLASFLPTLTANPAYQNGSTLVIVTFDEGRGGGTLKGADCSTSSDNSCHIAMLALSPRIPAGLQITGQLSLYDLLRTTTDVLGAAPLGVAADRAGFADQLGGGIS